MTDEQLQKLYQEHVTHTHVAALRAVFEAGRAFGTKGSDMGLAPVSAEQPPSASPLLRK